MKRSWLTMMAMLGVVLLALGCGDDDATDTDDGADPSTESTAGDDTTTADEDDSTDADDDNEPMDIVDTAVAAGSFETLAAALNAAGLVDTLKSEGPFTVFAPTDEAFAALPDGVVESLLQPENKDQLVAVLTYHVVSGNVTAEQVTSLDSATTVQGEDVAIEVSDGTVMVNDAEVTQADIICSNGVIHVIDTVLLPPAAADDGEDQAHGGIPLEIEGVGSFRTLFTAIEAAGLRETLESGRFTIFAPTDEAFAALPEGTLDELLKPENRDQLVSILTYHVVAGEVDSETVVGLEEAETVNGQPVSIRVEDGTVYVGDAQVIGADIPCEVGIIHVIDSVLLP